MGVTIKYALLGVFIFSIIAGITVSLTAVARLRGMTPDVYLFGQTATLLNRISAPGSAACIDIFDDNACSHVDFVRQVEGEVFEITSHISAAHTPAGRPGDNRIIVSKTRAVLDHGRLCADASAKTEMFQYETAAGLIRRDAPLRALGKGAEAAFRDKLGFESNGWDCMEYVEAPDWLYEGGLLRRGFKNGALTGASRRVTLKPVTARLVVSTQ